MHGNNLIYLLWMLLAGEKKTYSVILNINQWTISFGLQIKHQHAQVSIYQNQHRIKRNKNENKIDWWTRSQPLHKYSNRNTLAVSQTHIRSKTESKRFFLSLNNACYTRNLIQGLIDSEFFEMVWIHALHCFQEWMTYTMMNTIEYRAQFVAFTIQRAAFGINLSEFSRFVENVWYFIRCEQQIFSIILCSDSEFELWLVFIRGKLKKKFFWKRIKRTRR